jgi:transcription termination factor NusB
MNITQQNIREIGKDIGISYAYFKEIGLYEYARKAVSVKTWKAVEIEGTKWVMYSSLPESTRAKLPSVAEFIMALEAERKYRLYEGLVLGLIEPVSREDRERVDSFRVVNRIVNEESGEEFLLSETDLPDEEKNRVKRVSQFIKLLASEKMKDMQWREGIHSDFRKLSVMQEAVIKVMSYELGVIRDTNEKVALTYWLSVISKYKSEGVLSLISKKYGNDNAQKVSFEGLMYLIECMSNATKPTVELVASAYNSVFSPSLTVQRVNDLVNIPCVRSIWYLYRHGELAWKRVYGYDLLRVKPKYADGVWCSDGSKWNEYILTPEGKLLANVNMYSVVDVATGYMLSIAVAAKKEDGLLLSKAAARAFEESGGVKPYQWQYDGGGENKTFFKQFDALHFPTMPHNGQSKLIERIFADFQKHIQGMSVGFTGMNNQTRTDDSKMNYPEIVKMAKKHPEMFCRNMVEVEEKAERQRQLWNAMKVKTKYGEISRAEYYRRLKNESPERDRLTEHDKRDLFWNWRKDTVTYRSYGLMTKTGERENYYEVLDENGKPDIENFHSRYIGQVFHIKQNPMDVGKIALYIATKVEKVRTVVDEMTGEHIKETYKANEMRFVAYAMERSRLAYGLEDYQEGERKRIDAGLEAKKLNKKVVQDRKSLAGENTPPKGKEALEDAWLRNMDGEELEKIPTAYLSKKAQYFVESGGLEELTRNEEEEIEINLFDEKFTNTWN